jgi:Lrp/AsnC family transcriptional regulator, regulator for asnA, asnC and gidA
LSTQIDDLDRQIIEQLSHDARVTNRQIATLLGVTEGTIRGRIKRLEKNNCIRFTAITNPVYAGSPKVALIGVQIEQGSLKSVCRALAAMPEVGCVIVTLGRFDVLVISLFPTLEDVVDLANNRILALKGVRHVETSVAAKTIKYDYRVAKITTTWKAGV